MRKIGMVTAALLTIAVGAQTPAHAVDFEDILRSVLTSVTTTNLPYSSSTVQTSVDNRQSQLESQVTSGVSTGQLTVDEAADLRNRLASVQSVKASYLADGTLSYSETRSLLDDLTEVSRRLEVYLTNSTTVNGTDVNDHWSWFRRYGGRPLNNGVLPNADLRKAHLDSAHAELSAKIEQAAISGSLSWQEASGLRKQLNNIDSEKASYMSDGLLSYDEETKIRSALQNLETRTNREVSDANSYNNRRQNGRRTNQASKYFDKRQSVLRNRIDSGVRSGQLTRAEASQLYEKERQVKELEAQLRSSGNRLNWREEKSILNKLDNLAKQVDRQLFDRQVR